MQNWLMVNVYKGRFGKIKLVSEQMSENPDILIILIVTKMRNLSRRRPGFNS